MREDAKGDRHFLAISPHQKNNLCSVIEKKKSFDFDAHDTHFFILSYCLNAL